MSEIPFVLLVRLRLLEGERIAVHCENVEVGGETVDVGYGDYLGGAASSS